MFWLILVIIIGYFIVETMKQSFLKTGESTIATNWQTSIDQENQTRTFIKQITENNKKCVGKMSVLRIYSCLFYCD